MMLFVLTKCVTCLVTLVLTRVTVYLSWELGWECHLFRFMRVSYIVDYGVKKLIRVGTAGSLNEEVHVRELVLAQAAATNSNIVRNDWPQYDFPQIASFDLLDKAYHIAKELGMTTHVGNVLSSDVFYSNYFEKNIELGKWGVKAVEMEAAALYYLAAQYHVDALAIMTISDSLVNPDEDTTAEERQNTFTDMMKVGLETLIAE